jgi:hypothetical protein
VLFNNAGVVDGDPQFTFNPTGDVLSLTGQLNVDNIRVDGNTVSSTDTNGNIDLTPNGTGEVNISKVDIDSGAIDGTTIGANSAAAGTFTTATATTGNITTVNATTVDTTNLEVTNIKALDGTAAATVADTTGIITTSNALLRLAGTTSSFPALKRDSTTVAVRLADDSGNAPLSASTLSALASTANTSSIAATGYSLTGSSAVSMVDLAGTWNTTGTPTAIKLNLTDAASTSSSLFMDMQIAGVSRFNVNKSGAITGATLTTSETAVNSSAIASTGFSLTGSSGVSMVDLAGTWNTTGAPAGIKLNITNTASAAASNLMVLQTNGANRFAVTPSGSITAGSTNSTLQPRSVGTGFRFDNFAGVGNSFGFTVALNSTTNGYTWANEANNPTVDLGIFRDAADTLAQRRTTNAQTFRVYNTFTDASNYERGKMEWASNVLRIGTEKAGTGTARALEFQTDGVTRMTIPAGTMVGGQGVFVSDNFFAAQQSSGNLPTNYNQRGLAIGSGTTDNNAYFGTQVYRSRANANINGANYAMGAFDTLAYQTTNTWTLSAYVRTQSTQAHSNTALGTRMFFGTTANDSVTVTERFAIEQNGLVTFGGTTSSFPALKRSSTSLIVRLADDTANAPLESASVKTDAPTGGTSGTWKLGVAATVSPTAPDRTIEVDIGGTIYYIAAKTTND